MMHPPHPVSDELAMVIAQLLMAGVWAMIHWAIEQNARSRHADTWERL